MELRPTLLAPSRLHSIDLLRFIAALAVLLFHYTFRGYAADHLSPVRYAQLEPFTKYGYLGVDLFFIISGYVVLLSAYPKTVKAFFISRATRLYPAFWVACTATFLITYCFGPPRQSEHWSMFMEVYPRQYIFNMTMLQGLMGVREIDGVYWTLTYEIQFYFLITLLLAYQCLRWLPLILASWLAYTAIAPTFPASAPLTVLLFPSYSPLFIGGMSFFLWHHQVAPRWQVSILLIAAWGLSIRNGLDYALSQADYYQARFSPVIVTSVISLFYLVFLLISTGHFRLQPRTWLYWAGALTYPLYLIHHNIGYILYQRLGHIVDKYLLLGLLTALSLGLAYLLHTQVEKRLSPALKRQLENWLSVPVGQKAS